MKDFRDQPLNDVNFDKQERLYLQLISIREKAKLDAQKVAKQFYELRQLQTIIIFFILSGIITFFILISLNINLLIIIIDLGVVAFFVAYLIYLKKKYRRYILKKEFRRDLSENLLIVQLIFYLIIILFSIFIFVLAIIIISPIMLVSIIGFYIIYKYFENEKKV